MIIVPVSVILKFTKQLGCVTFSVVVKQFDTVDNRILDLQNQHFFPGKILYSEFYPKSRFGNSKIGYYLSIFLKSWVFKNVVQSQIVFKIFENIKVGTYGYIFDRVRILNDTLGYSCLGIKKKYLKKEKAFY